MNTRNQENANSSLPQTDRFRRRLLAMILGLGAISALSLSFATGGGQEAQASGPIGQHHRLILIKFAEDATDDDIETVKQKFCALGRSFSGLEEAVWVPDPSMCRKSDYTHAVTLRFSCPKAATSYRDHPECVSLEKECSGVVAKMLEMRYQTSDDNVSGPSA